MPRHHDGGVVLLPIQVTGGERGWGREGEGGGRRERVGEGGGRRERVGEGERGWERGRDRVGRGKTHKAALTVWLV